MIILINSSKTMRSVPGGTTPYRAPRLLDQARRLGGLLQDCSTTELAALMHLSAGLAERTQEQVQAWSAEPALQTPALDAFVGDIFKGLRAPAFTPAERAHADEVLMVLSGMYGAVRALDAVMPYRLELMYRLSGPGFSDLYDYWGNQVARLLPPGPVVNLASIEYSRLFTPYVAAERVISPLFLTQADATGPEPTFVTVHAKVARGAFARWMIRRRLSTPDDLTGFDDLGYVHRPDLSAPLTPAYVRRDNLRLARDL